MLAIAFTGVIQHEVEQAQLRRLTASVRADAGTGCIVVCNADGLFASAARLEAQIEVLFDSGIDVVFLGEQAIARNAGRSALMQSDRPLIRPANLARTCPGRGSLLFGGTEKSFWMLSVVDGTGKIPVEPPHVFLDKFFRNKTDDLPVIINVNGTDFDYRQALAWRYGSGRAAVLFFGCGTGSPTVVAPGEGCFLQHDTGSVVADRSIGGLTPACWWQRQIERLPVAPASEWGLLRCDYTVVWLNGNGKPQKHLQKTVML